MSTIDVESLMQAISADSPCGEDLEYDPAFGELERLAQGKAEQQIGDTIVEAEEPDWRQVGKLATTLFSRTKDIRVVIYLMRSSLHTQGFTGLCDGLLLLKGMLTQNWECLYPELDAEDNNDPTMRINALVSLCDDQMLLNPVRKAPLVSSRMMGQFSLRDIAIATGELQPTGGTGKTEIAAIDAAFLDADLEELQATADAVSASINYLSTIESYVTEQVGASDAASFDELGQLLKSALQVLQDHLSRRGVNENIADSEGSADQNGSGVSAAATPPASLSGAINNRDDVIRALGKIQDYYTRHEPASPVPMLMERAKQLVAMDFMQIIKNIAPDGLSQVEIIRGPEISQEDDY
ncbi:MAG: type VI secretion system protein TssA [Pseudomonadota bacterium]